MGELAVRRKSDYALVKTECPRGRVIVVVVVVDARTKTYTYLAPYHVRDGDMIYRIQQ